VRKAEYPLERAKHSNDNDLSFLEAVQKEQQENAAKEQSICASQQSIDLDYWSATNTESVILPAGVMKAVEIGLGLSSFRGTPEDDFDRAFLRGD